eukprot:532297_1
MACSIFNNNYNTEYSIVDDDDNTNINAQNIYGYLLCDINTQMIGNCDENTCIPKYQQSYFDQLADDSQDLNINNMNYKYNNNNNNMHVIVIII